MRIFYFTCLIAVIISTACQKEGCKDINAANYNAQADSNDGFCTYRYLDAISLLSLNIKRNDTADWDQPNPYPQTFPNEEYPDLKFYLKRKSSSYWEYQTDLVFDVQNLPIIWSIKDIGSNYLIMQEEYEYKLLEEDEKGAEIILEGSFMPSQVIQDNKILLRDAAQSTIIELSYIVS